MHWFLLAIAIVFETIGTTALKASDGFARFWPTTISIATYIVSFYLLSLVLRVIPVGIAYAIWSGFGIFLIAVIGFFVFNQRLDGPALLGLALIIAGILVINLFSAAAPH
ncbi:DMT family transporter [Pararhodobacter oceanensis]|uniref:QacE family quaternary ammonium compound efflux SMR transporter n=1 Tax=Pararhodobacter oceanensis TaxID=2172121 RepID=A0A2T8HQF8_9RHOB|nr:SMR family transporter [Pararhodobacter oceanensis]PVH27645.1 QacE family quaternary ammonium compound efflux SMR transporter [Pararhodobacter oceanensis]